MNINAINTSRNFTEKLPVDTISPPSDQKNADSVQNFKTIEKNDKESGLNSNKENKDALSIKEQQAMVDELNDYMDDLQTNLGFSIHEKMDHQVVIQVKNRKTEELIKQIPAEELINIKLKMEELSGLILDDRV